MYFSSKNILVALVIYKYQEMYFCTVVNGSFNLLAFTMFVMDSNPAFGSMYGDHDMAFVVESVVKYQLCLQKSILFCHCRLTDQFYQIIFRQYSVLLLISEYQ